MYIHFKNVVYLEFFSVLTSYFKCDKSVWRHISCLAWEIHVFHFAVHTKLMRIFWNFSFNGFVKGGLCGLVVRKSQKIFFLNLNTPKNQQKCLQISVLSCKKGPNNEKHLYVFIFVTSVIEYLLFFLIDHFVEARAFIWVFCWLFGGIEDK